jgi:hypothetical protein
MLHTHLLNSGGSLWTRKVNGGTENMRENFEKGKELIARIQYENKSLLHFAFIRPLSGFNLFSISPPHLIATTEFRLDDKDGDNGAEPNQLAKCPHVLSNSFLPH